MSDELLTARAEFSVAYSRLQEANREHSKTFAYLTLAQDEFDGAAARVRELEAQLNTPKKGR